MSRNDFSTRGKTPVSTAQQNRLGHQATTQPRGWIRQSIKLQGYGMDSRGTVVRSTTGSKGFPLHHSVQTGQADSGAHLASFQRVPGAPYAEIRRPGCEDDHSPPSTIGDKHAWSHIATPRRLHGVMVQLSTGFTLLPLPYAVA
jgi:hypothetical protein